MSADSLEDLRRKVSEFARERDWDQFHSAKNLCCALSVEAAELLEHFQWAPDSASHTDAKRDQLAQEIGDVLIYLVRLADKLSIEPVEAANRKLALNAERYPIALARGSSKKYTDF
jgi:dCTP diphosphatase